MQYIKERKIIGFWVMGITALSCVVLECWAMGIGLFFLCPLLSYTLAGFIVGYFYSYKILTRLHTEKDYSKSARIGIALLSFMFIYLLGALLLMIPIDIWLFFSKKNTHESIGSTLLHGAGMSYAFSIMSFIGFGFLGLIIAPISAFLLHKKYKKRAFSSS